MYSVLARADSNGRVLPPRPLKVNGERVLARVNAEGAVRDGPPGDARPPLTDVQFVTLLKRYAMWDETQ
jgi:hypothetical protein